MKRINFSAFIEDMRLDSLPKAVQVDISRFVSAKAHHKFPHYGVVPKELAAKADQANMKTARAHVQKLLPSDCQKKVLDATRAGKKYILVLNDKIIDGHHFLAKALRGGITSSLNVLDLTPSRFQFSKRWEDENGEGFAPALTAAGVAAAGTGIGYAGIKVGKTLEQIRRTAAATEKSVHNANRVISQAGKITESVRKTGGTVKRHLTTFPTFRKLRKKLIGMNALSTPLIQFRRDPEKERAGAIVRDTAIMGASAGGTSALLGGVAAAAKRGTTLKQILKSAGKAGALGGAAGAGAAAIGTGVLGAPKKKESAAYTKRGAVGGGIGGAVVGGAGALLALKNRKLKDIVKKAAKTWRPAQALVKSGPAGRVAIGAVTGGAIGAAHASDEGQQVDTIRSTQKKKRQFSMSTPLIQFSEPALGGKLAADRYKKKIHDDDLDRRDANTGRAAAAGIVAGALINSKKVGLLKRSAIGAGAGVASVLGVRKVTEGSKDLYGERSRGAKIAERLPQAAGLGVAAILAAKRLKHKFSVKTKLIEFARDDEESSIDAARNLVRNVRSGSAEISKVGRDVKRVGRIAQDAGLAVKGQRRTDTRGRPVKREWEKDYFQNAAIGVGASGAVAAHKLIHRRVSSAGKRVADTSGKMRKVGPAPKWMATYVDKSTKVASLLAGVKDRVSKAAYRRVGLSMNTPLIQFDAIADGAGWDVRDPRGRSARVFAPGSRRRERRPKEWHEKVDNQRRIAGAAIAAGTILGTVGGVAIGKRIGRNSTLKAIAAKRSADGRAGAAAASAARAAKSAGIQEGKVLDPDWTILRNKKRQSAS